MLQPEIEKRTKFSPEPQHSTSKMCCNHILGSKIFLPLFIVLFIDKNCGYDGNVSEYSVLKALPYLGANIPFSQRGAGGEMGVQYRRYSGFLWFHTL